MGSWLRVVGRCGGALRLVRVLRAPATIGNLVDTAGRRGLVAGRRTARPERWRPLTRSAGEGDSTPVKACPRRHAPLRIVTVASHLVQ